MYSGKDTAYIQREVNHHANAGWNISQMHYLNTVNLKTPPTSACYTFEDKTLTSLQNCEEIYPLG